MPPLSDALKSDVSNYSPVEAATSINAAAPPVDLQPGRGTMMRCPLPPLFQPSPDSLRSYYLKGVVPQFRIFTPPAMTAPPSGGSTSSAVTVSTSGGGSVTPSATVASTVAITTGVLSPGQIYVGSIQMSKSFQLLGLASSGAARFELYGTASAQLSDISRGLDVPPAAGTVQNIICDVAIDTPPYQWTFQNRVGANGDASQSATVYVSVTNLGSGSIALTSSLSYVGLETG